MKKKCVFALTAVTFLLASVLVMTSCAKKQVKTEQEAKPAPAVVTPTGPQPGPEKGPAAAPPTAPTVTDDEAAKKAEAERQARLRELEKAQRLRAEMQAFESTHIYFDFDKSDLKPEARVVLEKKAAWLRANPEYKVRIEGHCDERGTNEYNLALGERRANSASRYLNALGVSADRMSTISYGEERPADPGHNEEAWAKNRRDEFKLHK